MFSKHLVNSEGKNQGKKGRSARVIMTNEARVLRELRIESGLSMRRAANIIGCTDSYISHVENGRSDVPTGERLNKFLNAYGGMKQKSFYERVRRYSEAVDPRDLLLELVKKLPTEKLDYIIKFVQLNL
jgi:transcriptional regulator with XRE-family HTH domain